MGLVYRSWLVASFAPSFPLSVGGRRHTERRDREPPDRTVGARRFPRATGPKERLRGGFSKSKSSWSQGVLRGVEVALLRRTQRASAVGLLRLEASAVAAPARSLHGRNSRGSALRR
ncbi:hypothetical protein T484DRAFT_3084036 [Baffinella frigidus]|nr:hypothetical protein T484DRAFT_3084036 [Cryptophyta sp. CCMP2293]